MDAQISPADLERFRTHLTELGRAEGTVELYVRNVRSCSQGRGKDLTARLIGSDLAPKTLHTHRAALYAWADFIGDPSLSTKLGRIKLPPARRTKPKRELERADWKRLIAAVRAADIRPAPKAVLLIMALRGLRSGDVLRLRRREIEVALQHGALGFEAKGRRRLEYKLTPPIRAALVELVAVGKRRNDWSRVEDLVVMPGCKSSGLKRRIAAAMCVRRALLKVALELKISDVHPHRLRRTYAMYFLKALAGDPQAIIKLQHHMGWDSMNTAAGYVDAVDVSELDLVGEKMTRELE